VTVIKDYKIPIPSIEEQNKIINIAETLKEQKRKYGKCISEKQ
jgi:restriction endonuclease S subunit